MTNKLFPVAMLTGHRPDAMSEAQQIWAREELRRTMKRLQLFHGLKEAISGMALGADTWWAEAAVSFGVPFAAYIPFEEQPNRWPESAQARWRELRSKATRELVLGDHYSVGFFHARNDAMIRDADLCVALYIQGKESGGTYSAVKKIRALGKPLILLDPSTQTVASERLSAADN